MRFLYNRLFTLMNGPLAQLVEQQTLNLWVAGSIPAWLSPLDKVISHGGFMIKGSDIAKGTVLLSKGSPYLVVEREFVSPGKGSAFARVKMKSLKDGSVLTQTIKTAETVEDATVDVRKGQYQYSDGESFVFMDVESFEQIMVPSDIVDDKKFYLREGDDYEIVIWEGNAIDVKIPPKMIFVVEQSENYIKGDTVSGATKPIVTETGLTVRVPLFIKQGERILVNTETNEYQERVNN